MSRTRSVELAQQPGEITVARLFRRGLEGPTQSGGNAGMSWRKVDTDYPAIHVAIHVEFRRYTVLAIGIH